MKSAAPIRKKAKAPNAGEKAVQRKPAPAKSGDKAVQREPAPEPAAPARELGAADRRKAAVQLSPVRRQAKVGAPGDALEREADRVAERVVARKPVSGVTKDVQRAPAADPHLRRSEGAGVSPAGQSAADAAVRSPGAGAAITPPTRSTLESSLGVDLGHVRVHEGPTAADHARALGARAFAHDNHIWLGAGESQSDVALMAHETAHVLQQDGGVHRAVLGTTRTGQVDTTARTITWARIQIPSFKNTGHRRTQYAGFAKPFFRARGARVERRGEDDPAQRQVWISSTPTGRIETALQGKVDAADGAAPAPGGRHIFEVPIAGGRSRYYAGTVQEIAREFLIPTWGKQGVRSAVSNFFHVDHIVELQLAGWSGADGNQAGNALANMELLKGSANMTSGDMIREAIEAKILAFNRATNGAYSTATEDAAIITDIKTQYELRFEDVTGTGGPNVGRGDYWTNAEIADAEHIAPVRVAGPDAIGGAGMVRIFRDATGGSSRVFSWSGRPGVVAVSNAAERSWLAPLVITHKQFNTAGDSLSDDFGFIRVDVDPNNPLFPTTTPEDIALTRFNGARYGATFADNPRAVATKLSQKLGRVRYFSPTVMDSLQIDGEQGLLARGRIQPDIPVLGREAYIDFSLDNGELELYREFALGEINAPPPFSIDYVGVRVFYNSSRGLGVSGSVRFGIDRVGRGEVVARLATTGGFSLSGQFDFDPELFRPPARITVVYENGEWSFTGTLAIGAVLPGVRSGQLTVGWARGVLTGTGDLQLSVPGVSSGVIDLRYSEADGFRLGGVFQLTNSIPLVRSGEARLDISRNAAGAWSFGGGITAELDASRVPGLTSTTLSGTYRDGIFDARLETGFRRPPAAGTATVGVTNQAVDDQGRPVEGRASETLIFYGSGSLRLQLTEWLAADATIDFDRTGHVTMRGGVEVTQDIELLTDAQTPDFELPRDRRPGFDINIPIVQLGVADVSVDVGGSLNVYMRTSPLVLRGVRLDVFYDFDDPSATRIEGQANLHMDLHAGIEGSLFVGLSARILVLRGGGRITLTVGAGIAADLDASLTPRWSLRDGFSAGAELSIRARPEVFVGLTGEVYAEIDLLLGSIELWRSDPLNIADRRLPVDLEVGAIARADFREKPSPDLTLGPIEWIYPTAEQFETALRGLLQDLI